MMDIKVLLLLWFINVFYKKSLGSGVNNEIKQKEQLAKEFNKLITKNV